MDAGFAARSSAGPRSTPADSARASAASTASSSSPSSGQSSGFSVNFGGEILFDSISFRLSAGDRIGLIGKNGAGKSTLLQLIAGKQKPASGSFAKEKNCSIGYLTQDIDFEEGRTVLEEAYTAFDEIQAIEKQLEKCSMAIKQILLEQKDPARLLY